MNVRSRVMLAMLLTHAACTRGGCASCGPEPLAILTETVGSVDRDVAQREGTWSAAKAGARFNDGDGLRTGASASALVRVGPFGHARMESETTIRFRNARAGSKQRMDVEVEAGTAMLLSGKEALGVRTPSGDAIIRAGGALRIHQSAHGQRYEVVFGRALLATRDGKTRELSKGQSFEVEIGLAQMDAPPPSPPAAPPAPKPAVLAPQGEPVAAVSAESKGAEAEPAITDKTLDYSDVVLRAGTSATIYDPKPPTAVGFDVSGLCPQDALLEASGGQRPQRGRGTLAINLSLTEGGHGYHVSCADADHGKGKAVASGSVYVVHKSSTDKLPRTPPSNAIDLDGRRYTVMFQNLPPAIQVSWPKAPAADRYTLEARLASGKALTLTTREPNHAFEAGTLPEGENRLYFVNGVNSALRSRETTVVVKFDNAAPSASLRKPPVTGFTQSESVEVEGVALPDSRVWANGQPLRLDAQQRFIGRVPFTQDAHALAIRIEHPRTGIRYYIRRPASTQ